MPNQTRHSSKLERKRKEQLKKQCYHNYPLSHLFYRRTGKTLCFLWHVGTLAIEELSAHESLTYTRTHSLTQNSASAHVKLRQGFEHVSCKLVTGLPAVKHKNYLHYKHENIEVTHKQQNEGKAFTPLAITCEYSILSMIICYCCWSHFKIFTILYNQNDVNLM